MRSGTLLIGLFVVTCTFVQVSCITNREFFESVKDYAEDLESFDIDDPAIDDGDEDGSDVIELPGNADDELDMAYLLSKLDMENKLQSLQLTKATTRNTNLGWWRRRRRSSRRRKHRGGICRCHNYACNCCLQYTFKLNLIFKRYRFRIKACARVAYVHRDRKFSFTITFNGRRVFHHEISVRHPPPLCFPVPFAFVFKGCIEIYNINIRRKSLCLNLAAHIDLKFKSFRLIGVHIGCFRIPILNALEEADVTRLLETLQTSIENTETGQYEEVSLAQLPALIQQAQMEQAAEKYAQLEY